MLWRIKIGYYKTQNKDVTNVVYIHDTDASGHIISDVPGIIGHFGSFNIIRPPPGDPAGADRTPACVQMAS